MRKLIKKARESGTRGARELSERDWGDSGVCKRVGREKLGRESGI